MRRENEECQLLGRFSGCSEQRLVRCYPGHESQLCSLCGVESCPNIINSAARMYPILAGSNQVDPNSGTRPRLMKGICNFALSAAYTKSQCVSIVAPPPNRHAVYGCDYRFIKIK